MIGIFLGIIIGAGIGTIIGMCLDTFSDINTSKSFIISICLCVIISCFLGLNIEKHTNSRFVEEYIIAKTTIETSIDNDKIGGFERVELVKQATELNKQLAGAKYNSAQWFGFSIDKRVKNLEFITFDTGE